MNDTHLHQRLKSEYRDLETVLLREKLTKNPGVIPSPTRDDQVRMLWAAWQNATQSTDLSYAFKQNFYTNKMDGSEDNLVGAKLWALIGTQVVEFRKELLATECPTDISKLLETITPAEGVKLKARGNILEGVELLEPGSEVQTEDDTNIDEDSNASMSESSDDDVDESLSIFQQEAVNTQPGLVDGVERNAQSSNTVEDNFQGPLHRDFRALTQLQRDLEGKSELLETPYAKRTLSSALNSFRYGRSGLLQQTRLNKNLLQLFQQVSTDPSPC